MVSIDDIKEFLNLPVEETTYDVFLTKMRDQSIGRINNYCRREINYGARIETIDGKGEDIFLLKNYPLDSVAYIKYRENNSGFDHELCDPATDIIPVNKIGKIILLNGITLTEGKSNIQIKYFAGYSDDLIIAAEATPPAEPPSEPPSDPPAEPHAEPPSDPPDTPRQKNELQNARFLKTSNTPA